MAVPTLIFTNALTTGAAGLYTALDTLLTTPFSPTTPIGMGWSKFYSYSATDNLYFSLGSSQSERLYLRLTLSGDDSYISRSMCSVARETDGYMLNVVGGASSTNITTGTAQFEYWAIGNSDFLMLTTLIGSTYNHYYSGNINRFAPAQNSSIYGQSAPIPANTTTPTLLPYTIGSGTTLFLRTGFDSYGGYGGSNLSFYPGQSLYIVDQSIGTTTSNNQGSVILNSADPVQNTINVSHLSGATTFSSFAIVSVDPQPNALSTNAQIRDSYFLMLDDFIGELEPMFSAVDEFSPATGLPPENIQGPSSRNVYLTYPIRMWNSLEVRGTLYGLIDTPRGMAGSQDFFQTFDGLYKFVNFSESNGLTLAIGSII